jgi:carboxymethylenebutenolidase
MLSQGGTRHGPLGFACRRRPAHLRLARRPAVEQPRRAGGDQEIFGVNAHIRSVVDRFAGHGFIAMAPALFDHIEHHVELGYDEAALPTAARWSTSSGFDRAVDDVRAAKRCCSRTASRRGRLLLGRHRRLPVLGALRLPAVSYYGARTAPFLAHERSNAPLMLHFGEQDLDSRPRAIAAHREALPDAKIHVWPRATASTATSAGLQRDRRHAGTAAHPRLLRDRAEVSRPSRSDPRLARIRSCSRRPAVAAAADGRPALPLAGAGASAATAPASGSTSSRRSSAAAGRTQRRAARCAPGQPCDKLNIGALGNIVRQLHVHLVARAKAMPPGRAGLGRGQHATRRTRGTAEAPARIAGAARPPLLEPA